MKTIIKLIPAFLAASIISACSVEPDQQVSVKGEGAITLGVNLPVTKAAMSSDELLANTKVGIYKADFSGLVREYTYSDAPQTIYLPADSYRVDILAGEAAKSTPALASWEQKSYEGSTEFEVVAGNTTNVQVEAHLCNAVSKISFDSSIAENFAPGYNFTIALAGVENSSLVYDAAKSGSEGYFLISGLDEPVFSWTFSGNIAKDNSAFTKSGVTSVIEAGKSYSMTLKYTIKDGDVDFTIDVDYSTDIIDDVIIFEPVATGISESSIYEIWAKHATVHADVDEAEFPDPSAVKFAYRAQGSEAWTSVDAVRSAAGVYDAELTGLNAATCYEYKLVIAGEDQGDPRTFTTEAAPNVPNGSFEYVSKVSGEDFYKFYDPNCSAEEGKTMFWGSGNGEYPEGNKGSASMGFVITVPSTDAKVGSRSVCAQSANAVITIAAGNIFTGQFDGLVGTSGGKVRFGRPWTSRPSAVRLWVKYTTGKVDKIDKLPAGVSLTKNDYDRANVKIALGTWDYKKYGGDRQSPVLVNTTQPSTFVDFYTDKSTIANAEYILYGEGYEQFDKNAKTSASVSSWRQVTIPLNYHTLTEYPTHIIISCASSMYGDYFTGSYSAKLWIDGVELLYE